MVELEKIKEVPEGYLTVSEIAIKYKKSLCWTQHHTCNLTSAIKVGHKYYYNIDIWEDYMSKIVDRRYKTVET